jgi:hypothetical protein
LRAGYLTRRGWITKSPGPDDVRRSADGERE